MKVERTLATLLLLVPLLLGAVPTPGDPGEVQIGPNLKIVDAVFGYIDPKTQKIVPTKRINARKHPTFAWRLDLEGRPRTVRFREEFMLPAPAVTWGVSPQTEVSADRASAVTRHMVRLNDEMKLFHAWTHTPGDPMGHHVIKVWVDGVKVREFDFQLY